MAFLLEDTIFYSVKLFYPSTNLLPNLLVFEKLTFSHDFFFIVSWPNVFFPLENKRKEKRREKREGGDY